MTSTTRSASSAPLASVLLVEPQFVLRRTIVSVARDLGLVEVHEATSLDRALPLLASRPFDGLIVDIGAGTQAFDLIARLQQGDFHSHADIPVVVLGSAPGFEQDSRLQPPVGVRALRKPFKVGDLLQLMEGMRPRVRKHEAAAARGVPA